MNYFINIINKFKTQYSLLLAIVLLLHIPFLKICYEFFFNKLSLYEALIQIFFFEVFILFCLFFGDPSGIKTQKKQAHELNIFLIKYPTIDIKTILTMLDTFSFLVRNQNIDQIKGLITDNNQKLIDDFQYCITNTYYYKTHLKNYTISRDLIFPLRKSITVLDKNTIKIKVNRRQFFLSEDDDSLGVFPHYFILKNYENSWIIVDTNFCKKLKKDKITSFFIMILSIIGCLLYCAFQRTAILNFFVF